METRIKLPHFWKEDGTYYLQAEYKGLTTKKESGLIVVESQDNRAVRTLTNVNNYNDTEKQEIVYTTNLITGLPEAVWVAKEGE